jgi:hypothetical protein
MANVERQTWPSRWPRNTIMALLVPFAFLSGFWNNVRPSFAPLQSYYLGRYLRSGIEGWLGMRNGNSLVYILTGTGRTRPALNGEVLRMPSGIQIRDKKALPLLLSREGIRGGGVKLRDFPVKAVTPGQLTTAAEFHTFLAHFIYQRPMLSFVRWPVSILGLSWAVLLPFAIRGDLQRRRKARFGVQLRGPVMVDRYQFNRKTKGDGLRFFVSAKRGLLEILKGKGSRFIRLRKRHEAQSLAIIGDTGTGKTTLILQVLKQIQERNEIAFIYDPERQYVERFYNEERGDIILNPVDKRCPYWHPGEEIQGANVIERLASAVPVANSLYPYRTGDQQFFIKHAQDIFAYLLATKNPSADDLGYWFQNPTELDWLVRGTEHEHTLAKNSAGQRQGIIGTLNHAAYAMRLVPTDNKGLKNWTSRQWTAKPKGWIFITSNPATQDALRPLQSLWIDLTILNLLSHGERLDLPKIWFILDELASLQYLPKLQDGVTRSRKTRNPFVLGFHGRAQLDKLYREDAETILSQPKIKFLLRTSEPNAATWMPKILGEIEVERPRESRGSDGKRSWMQERVKRELVLPSEIASLNDLEGYLRYGDQVLRFDFPQMDLKARVPGLIPRDYSHIEPAKRITDPPFPEDSTEAPRSDAGVKLENKPKKTKRKSAQILEIRLPQVAADDEQTLESEPHTQAGQKSTDPF